MTDPAILTTEWLVLHAGVALLLVGLVVAVCCAAVLLGDGRLGLRRIERKVMMTPAEVRFWHVLQSALPGYAIFGQVSVGALLKPVTGLSRKEWWSTYGRFSQKVVDFAVVDQWSGAVVAIVELDDRSHNAAKDAARDALLGCGGYPVLRFTARAGSIEVRHRFASIIGRDDDDGIAFRPRAMA